MRCKGGPCKGWTRTRIWATNAGRSVPCGESSSGGTEVRLENPSQFFLYPASAMPVFFSAFTLGYQAKYYPVFLLRAIKYPG